MKAEQDAAASDFYSQLGGDMKEANRLRIMERAKPGYTDTMARQLPDDRATMYRQRLMANERKLARSQEFYAPKPSEQQPTVVPDAPPPPPPQEPVVGRIQSAQRQDQGGGFSGGDAQTKRRRVAPQRLTRALGNGDLSRLLGA